MAMASTARPSAVQSACFMRKSWGCWNRSSATSADALYTITMLTQTSSTVAMKRIPSDLSFRATATVPSIRRKEVEDRRKSALCLLSPFSYLLKLLHVKPKHWSARYNLRERSAVISRPVGRDTILADRGSLRSQRRAPYRAMPTDDCSPLSQSQEEGDRRKEEECTLSPTTFLLPPVRVFPLRP